MNADAEATGDAVLGEQPPHAHQHDVQVVHRCKSNNIPGKFLRLPSLSIIGSFYPIGFV